jgi:hypothetical protein
MKMKEHYIIEYLNCKKNFQKDAVQFQGPQAFEEAVLWGKKNLENFQLDMIRVVYLKKSMDNEN